MPHALFHQRVTQSMESVFHEKQEGSLCAQHCLNALLQGEYFNAIDLAALAQQVDEEERQRMAEGGVNSEDYCKFVQQPSANMDDSGYFSVQVIASALKVWSLELIPYNSKDPLALVAQQDPIHQKAYICNYQDHWFTVRKLGLQWFNLNSLLTGPELISDTYLSMFLAQLQQEGYSIFIVNGILPDCEADDVLQLVRVVQLEKPKLLSEVNKQKLKGTSTPKTTAQNVTPDEDGEAFQAALQLSLESQAIAEDADLKAALALSINEVQPTPSQGKTKAPSPEPSCNSWSQSPPVTDGYTEEEMLEVALKMSMES